MIKATCWLRIKPETIHGKEFSRPYGLGKQVIVEDDEASDGKGMPAAPLWSSNYGRMYVVADKLCVGRIGSQAGVKIKGSLPNGVLRLVLCVRP